jgi:hypothetical protein
MQTGASSQGGPRPNAAQPSEVLDAGQWKMVADHAAKDGRVEEAIFAVEQILKFIPPGEDSVPETAFWTPQGHALHQKRPLQFTRELLEVALQAYKDFLEESR